MGVCINFVGLMTLFNCRKHCDPLYYCVNICTKAMCIHQIIKLEKRTGSNCVRMKMACEEISVYILFNNKHLISECDGVCVSKCVKVKFYKEINN